MQWAICVIWAITTGTNEHNPLINTNCLEHSYNWTGLQIHTSQEQPPRFLIDFITVRTFKACIHPTEKQPTIFVTRHHENDMRMDSEEAFDSRSFNCLQLKEILNSSGQTYVDYLHLTCPDINPYDIITHMPLNTFQVKVICVLYDGSWHQHLTDYLKTYGFELNDFLTRVQDQISFVLYAYTQSE